MKHNLHAIALLFLIFLSPIFARAQPCIDGMAGDYPCDGIDQLSHLSNTFFGVPDASDVWGWTSPTTGREYALLGLNDRTAFVDISSPSHPIYLGFLYTASVGSIWRDIKVVDHYAYIVSEAEGHGMQVFDLNRLESLVADEIPVSFVADTWYDSFGHCHNIVADTANKFVYPVGTAAFQGGLFAVDVSDPLNPGYAGSNSFAGYVHDAQVVNYHGPDAAYTGRQIVISFNEDHLVVYDATDKSDIEVLSQSTYDLVGYTHQGWLTEDHRYMLCSDETDEVDFGINTRTIIWDMSDLDHPEVVSYVDLGTTSIDHNLYIKGDIVYEANYTSGLRIFDLLEVAEGVLHPFGYFDVFPEGDFPFYEGSWSSYPYFESGVIPVSSISGGLHILKPRFISLDSTVIKVCDENTAGMDINVNRRYFGTVNYSVSMDNAPGLNPELSFAQSDGAPAQNTVTWTGLSDLAPGAYPGEVLVSNAGEETQIPFVLIKGNSSDNLQNPEVLAPNNAVLPNQTVEFNFTGGQVGYVVLQVALDEAFDQIIYEQEFFNNGNTLSAQMPFDLSTYYWRVVEPTACGADLISNTGTFTIDVATKVERAEVNPAFALYPNPAENFLFVRGIAVGSQTVRFFDLSGRKVLQRRITGKDSPHRIDISRLSPGVYIARMDGVPGGVKFIKTD